MNVLVLNENLLPKVLDKYKHYSILTDRKTPVRKLELVHMLDKSSVTLRVHNQLTDKSLRGLSLSKAYMTPDQFKKYETLLSIFYFDNPSFEIILLS